MIDRRQFLRTSILSVAGAATIPLSLAAPVGVGVVCSEPLPLTVMEFMAQIMEVHPWQRAVIANIGKSKTFVKSPIYLDIIKPTDQAISSRPNMNAALYCASMEEYLSKTAQSKSTTTECHDAPEKTKA